jgi:hypothetical protein
MINYTVTHLEIVIMIYRTILRRFLSHNCQPLATEKQLAYVLHYYITFTRSIELYLGHFHHGHLVLEGTVIVMILLHYRLVYRYNQDLSPSKPSLSIEIEQSLRAGDI